MLLALLAAVALRVGPVPVTPDEARQLPPDALADRLLAPGHPPAMEKVVGPDRGEPPPPPPPPPGMPPEPTRVRLYLRAAPAAAASDFCEQVIVTLELKADGHPVDGSTNDTAYRWRDTGRPGGCDASRSEFFRPPADHTAQALQAVRQLAPARSRAASGGRLGFELVLDDQEGRWMRNYERVHPDGKPPFPVLTDARKALAGLAVDEIGYAGPIDSLGGKALDGFAGGPESAGFFIRSDWTVGIAWARDRVLRVRMVRAIPAPF